jgi:hypothetical protein
MFWHFVAKPTPPKWPFRENPLACKQADQSHFLKLQESSLILAVPSALTGFLMISLPAYLTAGLYRVTEPLQIRRAAREALRITCDRLNIPQTKISMPCWGILFISRHFNAVKIAR